MSQLIVALLVIAFAGFAVGVYRRMSLWRQGQAAAFSWMLLAHIPKRYLVDLHHIVARDKYIANTHHREYRLPFADLGVHQDLREVNKHPEYAEKREELLSMIWEWVCWNFITQL